MPWRIRKGNAMPFEKKKKYKTAKDYKQKNLYLNESDPYQYECFRLLELCGHKQAKFLGLLVHDYIQKNGINIDILDGKSFKKLIGLLEVQVQGGITTPLNTMVMQPVMMQQVPFQEPKKIISIAQNSSQEEEDEMALNDDPIGAEDLEEMNDALAAFKIG